MPEQKKKLSKEELEKRQLIGSFAPAAAGELANIAIKQEPYGVANFDEMLEKILSETKGGVEKSQREIRKEVMKNVQKHHNAYFESDIVTPESFKREVSPIEKYNKTLSKMLPEGKELPTDKLFTKEKLTKDLFIEHRYKYSPLLDAEEFTSSLKKNTKVGEKLIGHITYFPDSDLITSSFSHINANYLKKGDMDLIKKNPLEFLIEKNPYTSEIKDKISFERGWPKLNTINTSKTAIQRAIPYAKGLRAAGWLGTLAALSQGDFGALIPGMESTEIGTDPRIEDPTYKQEAKMPQDLGAYESYREFTPGGYQYGKIGAMPVAPTTPWDQMVDSIARANEEGDNWKVEVGDMKIEKKKSSGKGAGKPAAPPMDRGVLRQSDLLRAVQPGPSPVMTAAPMGPQPVMTAAPMPQNFVGAMRPGPSPVMTAAPAPSMPIPRVRSIQDLENIARTRK